jgi:hypothetical protein
MSARTLVVLAAALSVAGAIGFGALALANPSRAAVAYLCAFTYVLTLGVGALYWIMIGYATSALWFVALRRTAEHIVAILPVLALEFIPLPIVCRRTLGWTDVPADASPALATYVSTPFFVARAVLYWLVLCGFAMSLRHDSIAQDRSPSVDHVLRPRRVGTGGLAILGLTFTFACFDWLAPLDGSWRSTMYGVYVSAGAAAAGLALISVLAAPARRTGRLPERVGTAHFAAIGKLFLVTIMFWAYVGFCQLLLIWIADVPAESVFYARRVAGGWATVSAVLGAVHFGVPFLCLLSWRFKRSPTRVAALGAWLLLAHYVDVYWLVVPPSDSSGPHFAWLDLAALAAIGGPCLVFATLRARTVSGVPVNDPRLERSLEFGGA